MKHVRLLVENILQHPLGFDWQVQGLGMMRTYLSDETRLHIWDSSLMIPGVSAIHSHPWDMTSLVVAGKYKQHRFKERTWEAEREIFNCVQIKCGEDACTTEAPIKIELIEQPLEIYLEGQSYSQLNEEIHLSCPESGTVTLVDRKFLADRDHALVYWRGKGGWVDAKPRSATPEEVAAVTQRSLETWF